MGPAHAPRLIRQLARLLQGNVWTPFLGQPTSTIKKNEDSACGDAPYGLANTPTTSVKMFKHSGNYKSATLLHGHPICSPIHYESGLSSPTANFLE